MNSKTSDIRLALFFTHDTSLADWHAGGMYEREVALYKALLPHLEGIHFITYGKKFEEQFIEDLPSGIDLSYNRYNLPLWVYESYLSRLVPFLQKPPSIIKSNQMLGADIALKAARRLKAKLIARCGYLFSDFIEREYGMDSTNAQQARQLEKQVFSAADGIVLTTGAMKERVVEQYEIMPNNIHVIPNYVNTDVFEPGKSKRNPPHQHRLLFVGRLEAQKNLETLIDALSGLDVELYVAGNGSLHSELERSAATNHVKTKFLGNIFNRELPTVMHSSDLFILPSLYEGHPKALLEAMSCGLPVIGTNVPGIREIIEHRENGFLAEPTVEGLRSAIEQVISDVALQKHMGENARQYVLENVSLERVVQLELTLLESLL